MKRRKKEELPSGSILDINRSSLIQKVPGSETDEMRGNEFELIE